MSVFVQTPRDEGCWTRLREPRMGDCRSSMSLNQGGRQLNQGHHPTAPGGCAPGALTLRGIRRTKGMNTGTGLRCST